MKPKERVITALHHKMPDRVPTFFRRHAPPGYEFTSEQNEFVDKLVDVGPYLNMKKLENREQHAEKGDIVYDDLGIGRQFTGIYWEMIEHPLSAMKEPRELDDYPWPNMRDPRLVDHLKQEARKIVRDQKAVAVMGSWGGSTGIFELSWYMRGLEKFLMDLMINLPFAEALLDKQLELHKTRWEMILHEVGELTDIACTGDDLATQQSLLISPQLYREIVKPRQKDLIDFIKRRTQAKIYYHSCGAIAPLIPDLIEIGVEVLDPIQPQALDTKMLNEKYGGSLSFYGGVDVQGALPFGRPEEVRQEVFRRFEHMGAEGGLILGPSHWIQFDTPWTNIVAMYEAILECRYE